MSTASVIRADARALPLADASVDLVVTSPPYFALRSYQDSGEHYTGQLGSEATPADYLDGLIACTREMMRVLKPTGSIWVNLGDKYAQDMERSRNGNGNRVAIDGFTGGKPLRGPTVTLGYKDNGVPRKSLIGIPWRYALRCVDELGLILRAEVIWSKPNGLPESVTDRVRRSHEQWFHFVKQPRYFAAVDAIRSPAVRDDARAAGKRYSNGIPGIGKKHQGLASNANHALGSLPGSVWDVPTQPLTVPDELGVDHFAAFPVEWPRRIILGWSPSGICVECGEALRPTVRAGEHQQAGHGGRYAATEYGAGKHGTDGSTLRTIALKTITGYACACPDTSAHTRPSVVLDPFGGTGTTALAAKALGRHGISVDMSADYCRIAEWRVNDPGELAKALKVERPPAEVAGQTDMLELIGDTP